MKNKKYYIPFTLLVLFIINSILVINNKFTNIDDSVHNFVMRFYSEMTTKFMKVFTFLGSTPFIILLCVLVFVILIYKKQKEYAYKCVGILVISTLINNIVKVIVRRPRPEYITVVENTFSYPSGHTMASVTLYGFLIYFILKSKISKTYKIIFSVILGIIPVLVGISRIYLGAHYFSDVFGGALLSIMLLSSIDIIYDKTLNRKNINRLY